MLKMKERKFTGTRNPGITERELINRKLAREAAAEGIVLLKNKEQLLPLPAGKALALYGAGASHTVKGGTGSGDVNERERISIYQGLLNAGFTVTTEEWIRNFGQEYQKARDAWRDDILERSKNSSGAMGFFGVYSTTPFVVPSGDPVTKTDTDTAIYVLSRVAGEGADRYLNEGDYYLTAEEKAQITDACRLYEHVILILNSGGVVDISCLDELENIESVLYIAQPGMEGGNAVADVLSGVVTPSGKLADTWPAFYEDIPGGREFSHNNGNLNSEYYVEGIYEGYRYFDTFQVPVRYGFGYGLSYTVFKSKVKSCAYDHAERQTVISVEVENAGSSYAGKEVVQIYMTPPAGRLPKEFRRLAAFAKTSLLKPGEKETLEIRIPLSVMESYDATEPGWVLEAGPYVFWAGSSLEASVPCACLMLDGDAVLQRTENICPLEESLTEIEPQTERVISRLDELMECVNSRELPVMEVSADDIPSETVLYRRNADLVPEEALEFIKTLSDEQLVKLASGDPGKAQGGNLGAAGISVPGSAGETSTCAESQNLASIVLADGPAGLRLIKDYNVSEGQIIPKPFEYAIEGGIFCREMPEESGEKYYQYCTAIPVGALLAQTWDTQLVKRIGAMIGGEMEEFGVTLWLAPGMNIHRNPLCGRNFEYYSEDPLLSGKIASAMTQGVQSVPGCGTTIKHFACNNMEDNRKNVSSVVGERALREIYLKGFEIAVKESQPMSIMTSYNRINGVHAANNFDTCTKAARCEWGFEGVIMTDWTTTNDGKKDCTASGCMRAGNDLVMPGMPDDAENLKKELDSGSLPKEDLQACIARLVNVIWKSNRYEGAVPYCR